MGKSSTFAVLFRGSGAGEGGRGDGSRGEKTFRKIFAKKFGGSKKRCTFAPPNGKRGMTGTAGRPVTGRGGSRGGREFLRRTRNGEFIDTLRQKQ